MAAKRQSPNLLDLKPLRAQRWEPRDGDLVTLLVPKFQHRWLLRWFVPRLSKPDFKVRLDAMGSFIWRQCDGELTVLEIAERVRGKFGEEEDPDLSRIALFLRQMAVKGLIEYR